MTMNYRHATGYDDSNLVLRISSLSLIHGNEAKEISKNLAYVTCRIDKSLVAHIEI